MAERAKTADSTKIRSGNNPVFQFGHKCLRRTSALKSVCKIWQPSAGDSLSTVNNKILDVDNTPLNLGDIVSFGFEMYDAQKHKQSTLKAKYDFQTHSPKK